MSNNYDQNNENKYSNSYGENQNSQNKQSSKNQNKNQSKNQNRDQSENKEQNKYCQFFVHKKSGAFAGMPLFTYFWNAYIMFLCLIEIRRNE